MKQIAILGSTGSIGQNALKVVRSFPGKFRVAALTTNSNTGLLLSQIKEFKPKFVAVSDEDAAKRIKSSLGPGIKLFSGRTAPEELVSRACIDEVLMAISGSSALPALLEAIENKITVALANKEALVMAGPLVMGKAASNKVKIIPIDSEQSAIWQCLAGEEKSKLRNIYLTASGGPLRQISSESLKDISVKQVLRHPRWKMGKKITVDSATLMNKGLELLEAMFLFGVAVEKIKVVVHPEALIHSMVEFVDGVIIAQLSVTDMRIPIQYALSYPERLKSDLRGIDFYKINKLHFEKPDLKKFPCLGLAYRAAEELGTLPAVLNAANEVSVNEFLKGRIKFMDIPRIIEKAMDSHRNKINPQLEDIFRADQWGRQASYAAIERLN